MVCYLNGYLLELMYRKVQSLVQFSLIYINDLSDDIVSIVKLFAYDTSLFPAMHGSNISANELNNNLQKIFEWDYKSKMSFNTDLNKQAQEIIFSRKLSKSSHPKIFFNDTYCQNVYRSKHKLPPSYLLLAHELFF